MFKKIICATDGSESAEQALALATSLATESGGSVVLVHAIEHLTGPGARGGPTAAPDEDERILKLKQQVADLGSKGVTASERIVEAGVNHTAHVIADVAVEEHGDVIVIGTRGHTALAGLLLGSVAQRLLHIAACPVLVVPKV